jgi:hypothetical protein
MYTRGSEYRESLLARAVPGGPAVAAVVRAAEERIAASGSRRGGYEEKGLDEHDAGE